MWPGVEEAHVPRMHMVWSAGGSWAGSPLLQRDQAGGSLSCDLQCPWLSQIFSDQGGLPRALTVTG